MEKCDRCLEPAEFKCLECGDTLCRHCTNYHNCED